MFYRMRKLKNMNMELDLSITNSEIAVPDMGTYAWFH
jgi:hypothetical protein